MNQRARSLPVARDHDHGLLPERGLEHPSDVCEGHGFDYLEDSDLFYFPTLVHDNRM